MNIDRVMVRDFLLDKAGLDPDEPVDDGTELFSTGLIDSFSLMALVSFLEERCSRRIPPAEITLQNLDTIERIVAFCAKAH